MVIIYCGDFKQKLINKNIKAHFELYEHIMMFIGCYKLSINKEINKDKDIIQTHIYFGLIKK